MESWHEEHWLYNLWHNIKILLSFWLSKSDNLSKILNVFLNTCTVLDSCSLLGISVSVLNLQKCSCFLYNTMEIDRGKAERENVRKSRETIRGKSLSSKIKVSKVSEGTVRYCFLVMSSQADLNCDVKPGNSVWTCSSAIVTPVVFVFTSCTS